MKGLFIVVAAVAATVLLLRLIGSRLSRNHRSVSRIQLRHPPAMVWAMIRNLQDLPTWWPELKQMERLPDQVGQERWRQTLGNNFTMTMIVAESAPPSRMRTVVDAEPGAAFGGSWLYELTPAGEGSDVRITEEGWIADPFFRVFARLMGPHRTIDGYLRALARRFAEPAEPSHLP